MSLKTNFILRAFILCCFPYLLVLTDAEGLYERAVLHGDWIQAARRAFHKNPELGFEEHKTSEMIRKYLDELGVSYKCVDTPDLGLSIQGTP
jgi:hypothetical protein